ncbi:MAG TPA: hypothetical protein VGF25_12615 [Thermoleophilaceae bacterium]
MAADRYNEATFAATHNSYAGGAADDLGSLRRQLDGGVRFLELDLHDNDFAASGYRIGHESPGDDVVHGGGNPRTDRLPAWLGAIAAWSDENPGHAPITVALDLKDRLTDNRSFAQGNLARLNQELLDAFERLYPAEELGRRAWPTVDALRDRVIAVISGSEESRLAYVRDPGHNPAVAMNAAGRVVEVHDSGSGDLWYWTGEFTAPRRVGWRRHGWYDTGKRPAVALNDAGLLVEVHEGPDDSRLWYRVGRLGDDLEIEWFSRSGRGFPGADEGAAPSVRFADRGSELVREVHASERTGRHWYWNGRPGASRGTIVWTRDPADGGQTGDPLFDKARDSAGRRSIAVRTGSHGAFGGDTLLYTGGGPPTRRIRYRQLAFVEVQRGGGSAPIEQEGAWFFAASARSPEPRMWAQGWRSGGKVVRLWEFDDPGFATDPPPSFAATDHPEADWYREYGDEVGFVS